MGRLSQSPAVNLAAGFLLGCAATFATMEFFVPEKAAESAVAAKAAPGEPANKPVKRAKSAPKAAYAPVIIPKTAEERLRKVDGPVEELQAEDESAVPETARESEEEREARLEASLEKLRFLGSIDVNGMGRQERRSHERLQKRIAEREALEDMLESDIPDDERAMVLAEKEKTDAQIEELNRKVRNNLISIVAQNLGVGKREAKEVVKTIAEIINATE